MADRVSMKQKRREAPEWIFSWKRRGEPVFPKLVAVGFAVAMFGGLLGFVRIQTTTPNPWGLEKASVIHVPDTPEGRALALEARENGPSPVRFSTTDWPALLVFENEQLARLSAKMEPYEPRLRGWEPEPATVPPLSQAGAMVLPPLPAAEVRPLLPPAGPPQPVIWPLSGITAQEVPGELPKYEGVMDAAMQADSLRFLIQLDGSGKVLECIALSGGDTPEGTASLAEWVRGIRFLRESPEGPVWAALRIRFLNQPH
jgi:hypothetical protein